MSFFVQKSEANRFINGSLINPTHGWYVATATLTADTLYGLCFYNDGKMIIDGCTITRNGVGSGFITSAIYKYDSEADELVLLPNTHINDWNAAASGTQTEGITETVLGMGIHVLVIIADTTKTNVSGYTTQFPYTPLGLDTAFVTYQSLTKAYTFVTDLPATLPIDSAFWTYQNTYYGEYASLLLNQA